MFELIDVKYSIVHNGVTTQIDHEDSDVYSNIEYTAMVIYRE